MTRKFLVPIVLPADPAAAMEAATKQYVDVNAGSEVYVGDTDPIGSAPGTELWYDTDEPAALTNDLRWNTAWGYIGNGVTTGYTLPSAAWTDVPGMSVTWTAVAGRRYKVSLNAIIQKATAAGDLYLRVVDPGSTQYIGHSETLGINAYGSVSMEYVETPAAGSVTRKVQIYSNVMGGVIGAGATYPAYLIVEDVGPTTGTIAVVDPATPWTAYTPVISNTWAIGNGSTVGRYALIGKTVHYRGRITFGSSSTFGASQLNISLPVNALLPPYALGSGFLVTAGVYKVTGAIFNTSGVVFYSQTSATGGLGSMVQNAPSTVGAGHTLDFQITYEAV